MPTASDPADGPGLRKSSSVAIFKLAASLKKGTVAERIEKPAQLAHLKTLGADLGQGYLFARPMPVADFRTWLQHQGPGSPRPAREDERDGA